MSAARAEAIVPQNGEVYVTRTRADGVDETAQVRRVIRQTDQPSVWTAHDPEGNVIWIRYDADRAVFVRALGQQDGEPVPCE